jgi:hypothetical protein
MCESKSTTPLLIEISNERFKIYQTLTQILKFLATEDMDSNAYVTQVASRYH